MLGFLASRQRGETSQHFPESELHSASAGSGVSAGMRRCGRGWSRAIWRTSPRWGTVYLRGTGSASRRLRVGGGWGVLPVRKRRREGRGEVADRQTDPQGSKERGEGAELGGGWRGVCGGSSQGRAGWLLPRFPPCSPRSWPRASEAGGPISHCCRVPLDPNIVTPNLPGKQSPASIGVAPLVSPTIQTGKATP